MLIPRYFGPSGPSPSLCNSRMFYTNRKNEGSVRTPDSGISLYDDVQDVLCFDVCCWRAMNLDDSLTRLILYLFEYRPKWRKVLKNLAKKIGLDEKRISGHSIRAGHAGIPRGSASAARRRNSAVLRSTFARSCSNQHSAAANLPVVPTTPALRL